MPGQSKNPVIRLGQNAMRRKKRKALIDAGICPLCDDPLDRVGSSCVACNELHARNARAQRLARNGKHRLTAQPDGSLVTDEGECIAHVVAEPELLEACREVVERIHRRRMAQVAPSEGSG